MFAGNDLIRHVGRTRSSRRKTMSAVDDAGDPRQIATSEGGP